MDAGDTYLLIILLILLLFSSFFSSTETALMSVNKIKLRSLADGGNKRAALALDITENHTAKMLSAILIGNNIVNVSASSLATTLAYSFGGYMVSIATLILTVAILVFGEITPKNYATINAEKCLSVRSSFTRYLLCCLIAISRSPVSLLWYSLFFIICSSSTVVASLLTKNSLIFRSS